MPGSDQPGNWGDRHEEQIAFIYRDPTGRRIFVKERGEIISHLVNSIDFFKSLHKMYNLHKRGEQEFGFLPYHGELIEERINALKEELNKYLYDSKFYDYVQLFVSKGGNVKKAEQCLTN